jgi:two-component sensor histidine kinase
MVREQIRPGAAVDARGPIKSFPEQPDQTSPPETPVEQVTELLEALDGTQLIETEEFKHFLDHIPIAIVIARASRGQQQVICYANEAFKALLGPVLADSDGRDWSVFAGFQGEDEDCTLQRAILDNREDFVGRFRSDAPVSVTVEAYASFLGNQDGTQNYRVVALIDVTDRARAEREQFIRQIRDKDTLLKELQHRVRNNLQLVVALIRLEARNERINLAALAGRVESLQLLYHALSPDGDRDEIELGHYLGQIAAAVMDTYAVDGIRLDLKVEHAPVSVNIALPVGLLVNELLTNSFKHAFGGRGNGVITIECLHKGEDRYQVVVADDGVGLPADVIWPVPGKIGALIVQTLRENTKTDFNIATAPGKGVRVTLAFDHKRPPRKAN